MLTETKKCRKCGLPKNKDEFPWKYKSKGIHHSTCKSCTRGYSENYYKTNQSELSEKAKLHQRAKRAIQKVSDNDVPNHSE